MLRGNLSTRPFYNDRAVRLAIGAAALLLLLFTIFNTTRLLSVTARRGEIRARTAASRDEAARLRAQAATIQQGIDRASLTLLAGSAHEANDLIEQRTFSWTTLLAWLEKAMPMDVRLVSVSPRIDRGGLVVAMAIVARDLPDVDAFISALDETGVFSDVAPTEKQGREDGTFTALVEGAYQATAPPPSAPAEPATANPGRVQP